MAMILRRVAPAIRPSRIASSLIPVSLPPPTPVPLGPFTAARITPSLFRVPYEFSGKGCLGSIEMIRPIQTQSSSNDEKEEMMKSMEERLLRRMKIEVFAAKETQEKQEQSEKMEETINSTKEIMLKRMIAYAKDIQENLKKSEKLEHLPFEIQKNQKKSEMEKIIKSTEERIRRIQKNQEQSEKWENLISTLKFMTSICELVLYVLGAAFLWNITQKKEFVITYTRKLLKSCGYTGKKTQFQQEMAADGNTAQDNSAQGNPEDDEDLLG